MKKTTSMLRVGIATLCGLALLTTAANANLPVRVTDIVAADGRADPVVVAITIPAAAEYQVTLTDFGVAGTAVPPAASVAFALVNDADASTPLTSDQIGEATGNVAAGSYRALLVVVPDATAGRASIGVQLMETSGGPALIDQVDVYETVQPTANPTAFDLSFTIPADGDYTFELSDLAFPDALSGLQAIAIRSSDSSILGTTTAPGSIAMTGLVQGESIGVSLVATRNSDTARSLAAYRFFPTAGGADVAGEIIELGDFTEVRDIDLPAVADGTPLTLTVANFGALNALSVAVIDPATNTATVQPGAGSAALTATGAPLSIRVAAEPGSTGGVGLAVRDAASSTVFEDVVALEPAATVDGFAIAELTFTATSAGDVTVNVRDFAFPQGFASVNVAVVRDGAIVASNAAFGALTFAATAGDYFLTVIAEATTVDDAGLFGVDVTDAGGATLAQTTAAAGGAIRTFDVSTTVATRAVVELTDLGFPASFSQLSAVVTQGAKFGTLLGGGTLEFDIVPGSYELNVIAAPDVTAGYSSFAASVDEQAPAPIVSLATSATSVTTGGSVTLTWSSTNATACTATGAWTGARDTSGTETVANITAGQTFTLTCDGPGGSDDQSVIVSVTAAQSVSSGGGAVSPFWLLLLPAAWVVRRRRRHTPR